MNRKIFYFLVVGVLLVLFEFFGKDNLIPKEILPKLTPIISEPPSNLKQAKVIKVIDGDTIKVNINGKEETVRLIGIDTPEVIDPRKPVQCFGKEASKKAKKILDGKIVRLESDPTQGERDKYRRLLSYVFLQDGTFVNKLLIEEGYAHEYTYQSNPYKYMEDFKKAQGMAQQENRGLWNENTCKNL